MCAPALIVPTAVIVTVTPLSTVTFPTAVLAKVRVELAEKSTLLPEVHAVPPVADAGLLQFVKVVQVRPVVPSVRQNRV